MNRRRFIRSASMLTVLSLAGCTGGSNDEGGASQSNNNENGEITVLSAEDLPGSGWVSDGTWEPEYEIDITLDTYQFEEQAFVSTGKQSYDDVKPAKEAISSATNSLSGVIGPGQAERENFIADESYADTGEVTAQAVPSHFSEALFRAGSDIGLTRIRVQQSESDVEIPVQANIEDVIELAERMY